MGRGNFEGRGAAYCKVQRHSAVICAKTAEPMVMTFGLWVLTGLRNHKLDGGPDPPTGRGILGKRAPIVKYRDFLP